MLKQFIRLIKMKRVGTVIHQLKSDWQMETMLLWAVLKLSIKVNMILIKIKKWQANMGIIEMWENLFPFLMWSFFKLCLC